MSWVPPTTVQRKYREWPIASEGDWEYLGTSEEGEPIFYEDRTGHVYRGRVDEEGQQLIPDEEPSWEADHEETLGKLLERLGEEIGWESLTEFARDHLEQAES